LHQWPGLQPEHPDQFVAQRLQPTEQPPQQEQALPLPLERQQLSSTKDSAQQLELE